MTGRSEKDILYAIVGPTAVGKTRASFELAQSIGAEIVSVDSRQVYRYMDVGTDKISPAERRVVPHHLIDVADPDEVFTAADFVRRTESAAARIRERGKIPILAGGSPLYYRALEGALMSDALPKDDAIRRNLEASAEEEGTEALHRRLALVDPERAARIHPNDKVRLVRALEIFEATGCMPSALYERQKKIGGAYRTVYFGITQPRSLLYERIERRVAEQFHSGYPEEVKWLLDNGYHPSLPAMQGFGYRELVQYWKGELSFEEALAGDIRATKAFSRRQMTWFRQFSPILWYDLSETTMESAVNDMKRRMEQGDSMSDTEAQAE